MQLFFMRLCGVLAVAVVLTRPLAGAAAPSRAAAEHKLMGEAKSLRLRRQLPSCSSFVTATDHFVFKDTARVSSAVANVGQPAATTTGACAAACLASSECHTFVTIEAECALYERGFDQLDSPGILTVVAQAQLFTRRQCSDSTTERLTDGSDDDGSGGSGGDASGDADGSGGDDADTLTPTPAPTPSPTACVEHLSCRDQVDFCDREDVAAQCRVTCGLCVPMATPPPPPPPTPMPTPTPTPTPSEPEPEGDQPQPGGDRSASSDGDDDDDGDSSLIAFILAFLLVGGIVGGAHYLRIQEERKNGKPGQHMPWAMSNPAYEATQAGDITL